MSVADNLIFLQQLRQLKCLFDVGVQLNVKDDTLEVVGADYAPYCGAPDKLYGTEPSEAVLLRRYTVPLNQDENGKITQDVITPLIERIRKDTDRIDSLTG